jgi:hypothetical protein
VPFRLLTSKPCYKFQHTHMMVLQVEGAGVSGSTCQQGVPCCVQVSSLSSDKEEAERVARELSSKDTKLMEDKQVRGGGGQGGAG